MAGICGALDGGGTKTRVARVDRTGHVTLGPRHAGCNPQDGPAWAKVLEAALSDLAGVDHAVIGLPGFGEVPAHDREMRALVAAHRPGDLVVNDVELPFRAAFPGGDGVLILAGTGSMAMAAGPEGILRAGGWGDLFGDEGSGFSIGRAALARASREIDGRAGATGFAGRLAAKIGIGAEHGPYGLIAWSMDQAHPRAAIAALARMVDEMAGAGDPVARDLLTDAAGELVLAARGVAARANLPEGWPWQPAGSVFHSRIVLEAVAEALGPPRSAPVEPLFGGLITAAKRAGWAVDPDFRDRVAASCADATS